MKINVYDYEDFDILTHIPSTIEFIEKAQKTGQNVLVHCEGGISRSPTVVIAYIMTKYKMTYESAFDLVKTRREIIGPNSGFVNQLKLYEELGSTLKNWANDPKLRQYLVRINLLSPYHLYGRNNQFYYENYFNSRDIIESRTENLDYGQSYLCANCGYKLFDEIDVISKSEDQIGKCCD